ncbi:hypothetical protein NKDENANG_02940 [Candidatus Entotheonellaceae bacterium PAL068K]
MVYREMDDTALYEESIRDIVLSRRSVLGPWLVMGLGVVLALLLSYLLYANLLTPAALSSSSEQSLRQLTKFVPTAPLPQFERVYPRPAPIWGPAVTSIPQSRAADALLGGDGPALFPGTMAVTVHQSFDAPPGTTPVSH